MASKENQPGAKTRIVRVLGIAGILAGTRATTASAQFKIGAIISFTDPAAALGVGYKSAFAPFLKPFSAGFSRAYRATAGRAGGLTATRRQMRLASLAT